MLQHCLYRVGNGNLGALVTLIGFVIGEWLLIFGPLSGLRESAQSIELSLPGGAPATLPNLAGVNGWIMVIPIVILGGWWLLRSRSGSYLSGWDWRLAGVLLGMIGGLAWLAAWPTGWQYGVGIVGATSTYIEAFFQGVGVLNWGSFVVLSLPIGALLAALQTRDFHWQIPDVPSTLRMVTAGVVMGASAALAGGCNIGHTFTGLATLALSSLTASLFIFLGAWFGNYMRFICPHRTETRLVCANCEGETP